MLSLIHSRTGAAVATDVYLANDSSARRRGLLKRKSFLPGQGLWIVPCEAIHTFGMQFGIDVVFLDRNRVVRKIAARVPPGRIRWCWSAYSALELPPGTAESTKVRPGDQFKVLLHDGRMDFANPDALAPPGRVTSRLPAISHHLDGA